MLRLIHRRPAHFAPFHSDFSLDFLTGNRRRRTQRYFSGLRGWIKESSFQFFFTFFDVHKRVSLLHSAFHMGIFSLLRDTKRLINTTSADAYFTV